MGAVSLPSFFFYGSCVCVCVCPVHAWVCMQVSKTGFIQVLIFSCVCVCGQLQLRCMHKSVFPLWLSSCPAVVYAVACMCVRAGLCVCSGVQMSWGWCPASNKGFLQSKVEGRTARGLAEPWGWSQGLCHNECMWFWPANGVDGMLYPLSKIPNVICVYSLSHTNLVCGFQTWS